MKKSGKIIFIIVLILSVALNIFLITEVKNYKSSINEYLGSEYDTLNAGLESAKKYIYQEEFTLLGDQLYSTCYKSAKKISTFRNIDVKNNAFDLRFLEDFFLEFVIKDNYTKAERERLCESLFALCDNWNKVFSDDEKVYDFFADEKINVLIEDSIRICN